MEHATIIYGFSIPTDQEAMKSSVKYTDNWMMSDFDMHRHKQTIDDLY